MSSVQYADENGTPIPDPANGLWYGGMTSLRVGYELPRDVVITEALNLRPTQAILLEFVNRGYLRRPDLDLVGIDPTCTVVTLAYQKAGIDVALEMPCIVVTSRIINYAGVVCVGTSYQASCIRDSLGTQTIWGEGTPDEGMLVVEQVDNSAIGKEGVYLDATTPYRAYFIDGANIARDLGNWMERLDKTWKATCRLRRGIAQMAVGGAFIGLAGNPPAAMAGPFVQARIGMAGIGVAEMIGQAMPCQ